MKKNEGIVSIVREWIEKAENDLRNASHTLKIERNCPTDTVGFHSQQCTEKYIKAFLVFQEIDFPKTHDIGELVSMLPGNVILPISIAEQRRLTAYATVTRYPGYYSTIPIDEARAAVQIAKNIRR